MTTPIAELGSKLQSSETSISALVKRFLIDFASTESPNERLEREERELRDRIDKFSASDRLSRHDLHRRHR
jgi:hypothetical protein